MPEIFTIGFSEDAFVAAVAGEMATPGITPLAAASRCFSGSLLDGLTRTMGQRLVKDPTVSQGTWPARYETLADLAAKVFGTHNRARCGIEPRIRRRLPAVADLPRYIDQPMALLRARIPESGRVKTITPTRGPYPQLDPVRPQRCTSTPDS
jgi:hypothetical protein